MISNGVCLSLTACGSRIRHLSHPIFSTYAACALLEGTRRISPAGRASYGEREGEEHGHVMKRAKVAANVWFTITEKPTGGSKRLPSVFASDPACAARSAISTPHSITHTEGHTYTHFGVVPRGEPVRAQGYFEVNTAVIWSILASTTAQNHKAAYLYAPST